MSSLVKTLFQSAEPEELPPAVEDLAGPAEQDVSLSSRLHYMTPELVMLRQAHMQYQLFELSHFDRYLVFKYTLQSWQVNEHLSGAPSTKSVAGEDVSAVNKVIWARDFFYNYNFPAYGQREIPKAYMAYLSFFKRPHLFLPQQVKPSQVRQYLEQRWEKSWELDGPLVLDFDNTYQLALRVMTQYIADLNAIIRGAPRSRVELRVYKGSTPYPGVPKDRPLAGPVTVPQPVFNSTSYDPAFNYGAFIAEEEHWLLWSLRIPADTPCLIISDLNHCLPFEQEVLFPPGIQFQVTASKLDDMKYIPKSEYMEKGWRQVQPNKTRPLVAPVYLLNTDYDPQFRSKRMHLLDATVLP